MRRPFGGLRFREPVRRDRWHGLRDASLRPSSFGNQLSQAQLAVFGHVVQHEEKVGTTEYWRVTAARTQRSCPATTADAGDARLALKSLIVLQPEADAPFMLGEVRSLNVSGDGDLRRCARSSPASLSPCCWRSATERAARVAAPGPDVADGRRVGAGVAVHSRRLAARAAASRLFEPQANSPLSIGLEVCIARGSDHERWRLSHRAD
jgi:hypothetical protein